jgi:hypothetical protein
VGSKSISLVNIFMFRESGKSSKMAPGGSFFVYPCGSKKEIKFYLIAFSCMYKHEKEKILISVCPRLESW